MKVRIRPRTQEGLVSGNELQHRRLLKQVQFDPAACVTVNKECQLREACSSCRWPQKCCLHACRPRGRQPSRDEPQDKQQRINFGHSHDELKLPHCSQLSLFSILQETLICLDEPLESIGCSFLLHAFKVNVRYSVAVMAC